MENGVSMRARGQPSRRMIDRAYPHQVLVLSEKVQGKNLDVVILFHTQIDQPMKSRSLFKDDEWHTIYCFADPAHAGALQAMFGGEISKAKK